MTGGEAKEFLKIITNRVNDDSITDTIFMTMLYNSMIRVANQCVPLGLVTSETDNLLRIDGDALIRKPIKTAIGEDIDFDEDLITACIYYAASFFDQERQNWFKNEATEIINNYSSNQSKMALAIQKARRP